MCELLKGLDAVSLAYTDDKSLPALIHTVYVTLAYRLKMQNLHESSHMIIAYPSVIEIITDFWQCHSDGIFIELVSSTSMIDKLYVLTTWINTDQVLVYPEDIEEFIPLMQDYFDGNPTPVIVRAPWAQAIIRNVKGH